MDKHFDIKPLLDKMKLAADCGHIYTIEITQRNLHGEYGELSFNFTRVPDRQGFKLVITDDNLFQILSKAEKFIGEGAKDMFNTLEAQREYAEKELARITFAKKAANELILKLN